MYNVAGVESNQLRAQAYMLKKRRRQSSEASTDENYDNVSSFVHIG